MLTSVHMRTSLLGACSGQAAVVERDEEEAEDPSFDFSDDEKVLHQTFQSMIH